MTLGGTIGEGITMARGCSGCVSRPFIKSSGMGLVCLMSIAVLLLVSLHHAVNSLHPTTVVAAATSTGSALGFTPLHPNRQIACSACEMVVGLVATLMKSPRRDLLRRTVVEMGLDGKEQVVSYVTSRAFVRDLLGVVCDSSALTGLRLGETWSGRKEYVVDTAPNYRHQPPVEPGLQKACNTMTRGRYELLLTQYLPMMIVEQSTMNIQMIMCGHLFETCAWKLSRWRVGKVLVEEALVHDRSLIPRLLPFVLIALSLPFLIVPVFRQKPFTARQAGEQRNRDNTESRQSEVHNRVTGKSQRVAKGAPAAARSKKGE